MADSESEDHWKTLFKNLIARGFDPKQLKLVSSDGGLGIPGAIATYLPNAKQQRCMTHKVRGIERHMNYLELPKLDDEQKPLKAREAKKEKRFNIVSDAYKIFDAPDIAIPNLVRYERSHKLDYI